MRKNLVSCALALLLSSAAAGCRTGPASEGGANAGAVGGGGKDAGVIGGAVAEVNSFTDELLRKIDSAPDPAAGADEAQAFLDARKSEMKARLDAARASREFQESAEARGRLLDAEVTNVDRVSSLRTRHLDRWMRDPGFKSKLDRLVSDYDALWPRAG
jgi:hypothetical protein